MVHAVARHVTGTGERLATVAAQVVGLVGHGTFVVGVLVAGQPLSKTKNQSWSEKQPLTTKQQYYTTRTQSVQLYTHSSKNP